MSAMAESAASAMRMRRDRQSALPQLRLRAEVDEPAADQHGAEQHEVAVRERLLQPGGANQEQPRPSPCSHVAVKAQQQQRKPKRRERLDVADPRRADW